MKFLIILLTLISSPIYSWNNISKDFESFDTAIRYIWAGGTWQHDGKEGFYRFLVAGDGYEHYKTKLYVQWITQGSDSMLSSVLSTIEIIELNESPIYSFNLPKCVGDWSCADIEVHAEQTYSLNKYKFKIKFTDIGKYELIK